MTFPQSSLAWMYPHYPYTPFEASSCIAFPPTTGGSDYRSYNAKQPHRVVALGRLRLFDVHLTRPKQEVVVHGELSSTVVHPFFVHATARVWIIRVNVPDPVKIVQTACEARSSSLRTNRGNQRGK